MPTRTSATSLYRNIRYKTYIPKDNCWCITMEEIYLEDNNSTSEFVWRQYDPNTQTITKIIAMPLTTQIHMTYTEVACVKNEIVDFLKKLGKKMSNTNSHSCYEVVVRWLDHGTHGTLLGKYRYVRGREYVITDKRQSMLNKDITERSVRVINSRKEASERMRKAKEAKKAKENNK